LGFCATLVFMIQQKKIHLSLLVLLLATLTACSGGSLDSETNTPSPKVIVNAGANKSVDENTTVTLGGEAVGQSTELSYQWRVSPNLLISHEDAKKATATFVAPSTITPVTYLFTLEVTDTQGNKGSDNVEYQILPVNLAPIVNINASQFSGLESNQYPAGVQVILDGSASYDPDASDVSQAIKVFKWQQTAGTGVLDGISTDGASLVFMTPILEMDNNLRFSLAITDEESAQVTASINLSVQSASHTLPIVNAGLDHQLRSGEMIILAGVASTTVPAAEPLQYRWLNDPQLSPFIANTQQAQTYAIAPKVASAQVLTFTLEVTDAFGNIIEDSLNVSIRPTLNRPINDTGVVLQATNTTLGTHQQNAYPGQDGQRGQDIMAVNGLQVKAGRGEHGFDFTRLDHVGDEADVVATQWSCVRDNVTGLIWEIKSASTSTTLQSNSHRYTWYAAENEGDPSGTQTSSLASCSLTECNTTAYVEAINELGLCNFNDWRLPSHQELLSLVHFGHDIAPMIDVNYFPHTTLNLNPPVWYWTNQSSADGAAEDISRTAWALDFASGNDNFLTKSTPARIRLVRAGR
jgi:chitinase